MKNLIPFFLLFTFLSLPVLCQQTEFTSGDALNVKSFSISEITDNGKYIIGSTRSRNDRLNVDHGRFGDPNYLSPYTSDLLLINTISGDKRTILPANSKVGSVRLSHSGNKFAYFAYEDMDLGLYLYDIEKAKSKKLKLKSDLKIASNSSIIWSPDEDYLLVSFRTEGWSVKGDSLFTEATTGPITVYDSKMPFLKWDFVRNHSSLAIIAKVDIKSGDVIEILPEGRYSGLTIPDSGNKLIFSEYKPKKTVYDRKGGTDYGLFAVDIVKGAKADTIVAMSEKRISTSWNNPKSHFAYADSGRIYIRNFLDKEGVRLSTDTTEIVKKDTAEAKFSFMRWSKDDKHILARSKSGYWKINIENREMTRIYNLPEDPEEAPNLSVVYWSDDLNSLYMTYSAKDKWERGLVRYDVGSKDFTDLVKDSNLYSRWVFSEDGKKLFYNFSDGNMPADLYSAGVDFKDKKRITDLNSWIKNKTLTRSELVKYRDSDGKELYGVLYYPVNYEEGKKYPLVCEIYESFFNNGYSYSMNLIANAGYFGFKPSVNLINGYPGEAWIKGITAGINLLIDRGLVDEDKLGVHGTSYGGYAASLLISQTDRFAAAINISGKTNIISFLGDSPRIGTRNYTAAEVGQDRIGASLWDAPMKYYNTSAVMFADRINTPHLLLTGEGDWNVPALNTRELYYAMRRLGKEVVWVNYINGGHGAGAASNKADFLDHWSRIIGWYSKHFEEKDKE